MVKYALTGTPGTGKTAISNCLLKKILHLSDLYPQASEGKNTADEWLVDIKKLNILVQKKLESDIIVEGHFAHLMDNIDTVIVLRCDPNVLKSRLEERSYSESKIKENLEAEAIGVIYSEALETVAKNRLFQLDTTDLEIRDSCKILKDFFDNKVKLDETIDYSERILEWY